MRKHLIAVALIGAGFLFGPSAPALAIPTTLSSAVVEIESQLNVDGQRVESPSKIIDAVSLQPVFFGYTQKLVTVHIFSDGVAIGTANTDTTGNWKTRTNKSLAPGVHKITMQLTDTAGATGQSTLAATVRTPDHELKPSYGISIPNLPLGKLNYVTVSLAILAGSALSGVAYVILKWLTAPKADA